jgi:hypothetical protein
MPIQDLTNQTFNGITAIKHIGFKGNDAVWLFKCHCGKNFETRGFSIKNGRTKSCGCSAIKHGMSNTKVYDCWANMIQRCYDKDSGSYPYYGGRGIKVCRRWKKGDGIKSGFQCFYNDMGDLPENKSIDRINSNKNYSFKNCRWATKVTQANNTNANIIVEYKGKTYTLPKICKKLGLGINSYKYIHKLIAYKRMSFKKALKIRMNVIATSDRVKPDSWDWKPKKANK